MAPQPGMPAPVRKTSKARLIISGVVVLVVVVVAVVGFIASRSDPDNAKVGSCMVGQTKDNLKITDCGKTHDWTVVGKVEGKTQGEFEADSTGKICADAGATTAEVAFWKGKQGEKGYILCLAPVK